MPTYRVTINMGYCGTDSTEEIEAESECEAADIAYGIANEMISVDVEGIINENGELINEDGEVIE